jgi:hypothetical protein
MRGFAWWVQRDVELLDVTIDVDFKDRWPGGKFAGLPEIDAGVARARDSEHVTVRKD